jgi:AP-2 complex subunit alpha
VRVKSPTRQESQGEDLLGLGSSGAGSLIPADDDLLGPSPAPAPAPGRAPIRIPEEMRPQLAGAFRALVTSVQGVLFENDVLQIGVKHEYRGFQGRVMLFYGNKTPNELTAFTAAVADSPHLRFQSQDPGTSVAARQQARHQLMVECTKPYELAEAPKLSLSFSIGPQPYLYEITLPVVPTCFTEPVTLAAPVSPALLTLIH